MTTLTLTFDLADPSGIELAVQKLQMLLGKGPQSHAPAPAGAASTATAPAGAAHGQTGGASTHAAASAAAKSQVSTAATGDAGNAAGAAGHSATAANASSQKPSGEAAVALNFDKDVKKPFLELNSKKGRPACESVLKEFGLAKLSEATPEQYTALKAAIEKASA